MRRNHEKAAKRRLSDADLRRHVQELREMEADTERRLKEARELDPFWFYQPSDGTLNPAGRALLEKYLKPKDIPSHFDSQMDVHCSTASIIGDFGGNQSGKTVGGTIETLIKATGEVPDALRDCYPPEKLPRPGDIQHIRVIAQDYDNGVLKVILPTLKRWIPKDFLIDRSWDKSYVSGERVLYLGKKGKLTGTIEFMSGKQDPASHGGPRKTKLWFDEEPPYAIFEENLMRLTTAERMDIIFTMTPTKGLSWVNDEILMKSEDKKGHKIDCFAISTATNPHANMDVLDEILSNITDYEVLKMRLLGEFVSLAGLVYGKVLNQKVHFVEPFDLGCNCGTEAGNHPMSCNWYKYCVIVGMDPHQVTPTAMVFGAVDREGYIYWFTGWQEDADTEIVKSEFWRVINGGKHRFIWATCDPSCDNEIEAVKINIYKKLTQGKNGIRPLRKADKYPGSILGGIDEIKQGLKYEEATFGEDGAELTPFRPPRERIFDVPELAKLRQSMRTLERQTRHNEDKKGPIDKVEEGRHHLHAAFRYPHQFRMTWMPPTFDVPEYKPINARTGW